jgi:hypothetical protein
MKQNIIHLHYYNTKGYTEPRVEEPVGGRKDFGKPETLPSALCYLPIYFVKYVLIIFRHDNREWMREWITGEVYSVFIAMSHAQAQCNNGSCQRQSIFSE